MRKEYEKAFREAASLVLENKAVYHYSCCAIIMATNYKDISGVIFDYKAVFEPREHEAVGLWNKRTHNNKTQGQRCLMLLFAAEMAKDST